ncbi:MAG: sugar phosphate isomerase/epimerase [Pirellula sp.]|nr:sugar phosphate isomerase/epimerase [Pirellula sp.]
MFRLSHHRSKFADIGFALTLFVTFSIAISACAVALHAQEIDVEKRNGLFRQENLMAWCIVPFDSFNRPPIERAKMLSELGIKKFAYDYRAEHVPTFEEEILALKQYKIELTAWWFPGSLNDEARMTLALFEKHHVTPQLWVMGGGDVNMSKEDENRFLESEVNRLRPIADAGNRIGCSLALYNHGGWFGVPENMVRLVKAIDRPNVGIVYNLHHAHDQLDRLAEVLNLLKPHLLALNVNGMETKGDQIGKKILVIGEGNRDAEVFRTISESGYEGPIGILNHTQEDAKERLSKNLMGLQKLMKPLK